MADFDTGLQRNKANYATLTPIDYLQRAASVYGDRLAIVHGPIRQNWAETNRRCTQLAVALRQLGVQRNSTVAVLLHNTPAMVEAHFGVPMSGGVLCSLNVRLDTDSLIFCLEHGEAEVLLVDSEFDAHIPQIRRKLPHLTIVQVNDALGPQNVPPFAELDYESLLASAKDLDNWQMPSDEWDAIALNYTSGTTGNPKGVVYHHRGAALNALSNILEWDMVKHPVYMWTLPLFHCNGWCFAWTVAARAGVNVCLRKFDAKVCLDLIRDEKVTHYCAAPVVHSALANAPDDLKKGIDHTVKGLIAGAAPPEAVLASMEKMGFDITHVYGLTEVYGPASVCAEHDSWQALSTEERAKLKSRQGVRYHLQAGLSVKDPSTMEDVKANGAEMGELMFRGNIVMKGYLKNPHATQEAFDGGWFHTGDLGVMHEDGYVQIKDRSKDIIISGGENISSIEVEDVLYKYPGVANCAVVALSDEKWGEIPVAFVELKEGAQVQEDEILEYCRDNLARFKVPKKIIFGELQKTATGKIQKYELRKQAQALLSSSS
ncbi:acyl-CoA synthetase [Advenella sp. WQ 585]|uniref:Acyl-CoA synthetase n=1 Tax=Advenella mandrilli TaxID=2800330 RepID=A0ABS1E8F7_9BURK|nr:acyl-CoA synthetase [Advenella mandrilli]MBK1779604.1 acyl-CoA synthetase [Advenella mandrilli]